jgi:phosphate uptake regulator
METRKVQTVGSGTYTVSLPKGWAEAEGIEAGDVVALRTHVDGTLVVRVRDRRADRRATATVDGAADVERAVRAAYAAGCEAVTLDADGAFSDAERAALDRCVRTLTGVTADDDGDGRATVRAPLDPAEVSVRQSVRQLRFVALSMHRDATTALCGGEWGNGGRDDQADRLYAMVDRHLARGLNSLEVVDALGVTRPELFGLWATASELERVADIAERIGRIAAERDEPVAGTRAEAVRAAGEHARDAVDRATDAVVGDTGADTARLVFDDCDRALDAVERLDYRLGGGDGTDYRLGRAVDGLRRTAERGETVAELALGAAIRRDDVTRASGSGSSPAGE